MVLQYSKGIFFLFLYQRSHAAYDVQLGHPSIHPGSIMPFPLCGFSLLSPPNSIELGLPRLVPPPRLSMPSLVGRDLPSIKIKFPNDSNGLNLLAYISLN